MKKYYILSLITVFLILFGILMLNPGVAYCESETADSINVCENYLMADSSVNVIKPAAPQGNETFFPILITSVIVLGILIFAMWQTFKSRRQY